MIIKLYKKECGLLRYWEVWDRCGEVIFHWGNAGEEGTTQKMRLASEEDAASVIEREAERLRAQGYQRIDDSKLRQIVIEYPIVEMGTNADLDKRYEIEALMNERLGWTGLGHCDGGDIGGGTMNIFCFVVDAEKATACVIQELKARDLLSGARILLFSDGDEHRLLFPLESLRYTQ